MKSAVPAKQMALIGVTALAALLSLVDTPYPDLAPLQNLPTLAVLFALWLALRRWPVATSAVACMCGFLLLHTLGGRYVYSNVPYDAWFISIGLTSPSDIFGWDRNHYDRLVHFAFGALLVHPIAAFLHRHGGMRTGTALYVAAEALIAASALYEVFEWLLTLAMASENADAYNGQQGDIWDAQKDMALAAGGAVLAAVGEWLALRKAQRAKDLVA
jgi:putative membrane protein